MRKVKKTIEERKLVKKKYRKSHRKEAREYRKNHKKETKEYRKIHKGEIKEYSKEYYENNREEKKKYGKEYYKNNKERRKEYAKKYRDNHKGEIKEYRGNHKEKRKEYDKNHKKEREKYKREYEKNRRKIDINYRITCNIRSRVSKFFKGNHKPGSAIKDMGCIFEELKTRFENLFTPGMTWENYGEWHIDHIIPLSSFDLSNREEFLKACHYTNLQPLWAEENLSKGNKFL